MPLNPKLGKEREWGSIGPGKACHWGKLTVSYT